MTLSRRLILNRRLSFVLLFMLQKLRVGCSDDDASSTGALPHSALAYVIFVFF
jgi:hypothetical protein